eukprot:GFUD01003008.1.p1 GENE.GFUD01003008.1~~GFUD01003008.1.p1  ORF type:complete len:381 (+),score=60.97 GFUD01003008.1:84-1226(+)
MSVVLVVLTIVQLVSSLPKGYLGTGEEPTEEPMPPTTAPLANLEGLLENLEGLLENPESLPENPESLPENPESLPENLTETPPTTAPVYGASNDPLCHKVEKIEWVDHCEDYVEKTCYTQNKEECETKAYNNCTSVIITDVDRACFKVVEMVCSLEEHIKYETVEETYKVTKCTRIKDRICDTIFDVTTLTKDVYECLNLTSPNCYLEDKVLDEVTCTHSVEFDCKREAPDHSDGYGIKAVVCHQKPTSHCYDVPRTVHKENCTEEVHKYCEKFSNQFPFPQEKQNCHFETKKICEIQGRTRPKKAKVFTYSKDCKPVEREICDTVEKKRLVPTCEIQDRFVCSYVPVEQCNDEAKQYCQKDEKIIIEEVCDIKIDTSYL